MILRALSREAALKAGMVWDHQWSRREVGGVKANEEIAHVSTVIDDAIRCHVDAPTFMSCMTEPKLNRYREGDFYGRHHDSSHVGGVRSDYAVTLMLSEGFEGGRLIVETPDGEISPQLEPGECFVYECGHPHQVTPVESGERIVALCWVQSHLRDPRHRRVLTAIDRQLFEWKESGRWLDDPEYERLAGVRYDLYRMWA